MLKSVMYMCRLAEVFDLDPILTHLCTHVLIKHTGMGCMSLHIIHWRKHIRRGAHQCQLIRMMATRFPYSSINMQSFMEGFVLIMCHWFFSNLIIYTSVSNITSIFSLIFHAIYGAVCIQLTHLSYDDCENMCTLSYYHHLIGSMTNLPLL